jgi:hypothetical protein
MTIQNNHGGKQRSKQNQKKHIQLAIKPFKYALSFLFSSRDEKIRTSDLQHPMLARYRATLHPELLLQILNQAVLISFRPTFPILSGRDTGLRYIPNYLFCCKF